MASNYFIDLSDSVVLVFSSNYDINFSGNIIIEAQKEIRRSEKI